MKGLQLHKVAAEGPTKLYSVQFHPGVNLISGAIFTGKTSVLDLVDYCLGAKTPPGYPELSKCDYAWLDLSVNSERFTIRRSLRSPTQKAEISEGDLDFARESEVRFEVDAKHTADEGSISGYILTRLGLGGLQAKRAPTKEGSKTSSVSLRDLMFFCYVDQDRISSSKGAFLEDNPFRAIKWKATFEILHELHDESATALARRIENTDARIASEQRRAAAVERFLGDASVPSRDALKTELEELRAKETSLVEALAIRRQKTKAALGSNLELVSQRDSAEDRLRIVTVELTELNRELSSLSRLRVQYQRELEQLEFILQANLRIGTLPVVRCPACLRPTPKEDESLDSCHVCHQEMPIEDVEEISVERRIRAARRRVRDLDGFIAERKSDASSLATEKRQLRLRVDELARALNRIKTTALLPLNRELLDSSEALGLVRRRLAGTARNLHLRSTLGEILLTISHLQAEVEALRNQSAAVPDPAEQRERVINGLTQAFERILSTIRFPAMQDVGIDEQTYLPIVRGAPYGKLSSKGAIALTVSAWHLALLGFALDDESEHPRLLMLDSPLNHVGRAADDPEFRDQRIVDDFYAELRRLHDNEAARFQLVFVDNNPPDAYVSWTAARFTGDPAVGRYGFIDDETSGPAVSSVDGEGTDQHTPKPQNQELESE